MQVISEIKKVYLDKIVLEDELDMAIIRTMVGLAFKDTLNFTREVKKELNDLVGYDHVPILEDTVIDRMDTLDKRIPS